jgi:predicted GTPase
VKRRKVIIMGAAGRDFHNFNVVFKNDPNYEVVCFTAAQIPYISNRIYPKELAGKFYPKGIPIYPEDDLEKLIKKHKVDDVVFSYSDVSYDYVMRRAALVNSCGANFVLLGAETTMIKSKKPVISICAVRTGCGKSPTTRAVVDILKKFGKKPAVIRHPMPYGDLKKQAVQRFSKYEDFEKYKCTIEEMEEYEPYIEKGIKIFAGVDYEKILKKAEKEADIIVWDGGNNDTPFYKPDLHIVLADARRPGHEISYYSGEANIRLAHVIIINKIKTGKKSDIDIIEKNIRSLNKNALILKTDMKRVVEKPEILKSKNVLVIEDGPTITHGGLSYGAAYLVAKENGAKIIDPRPYAIGSIKKAFEEYKHIAEVLPALGYSKNQMKELEKTINKVPCDVVVIGTPIDLSRFLKIKKPFVRVKYMLEESKELEKIIKKFLRDL